MLAGLARLPPVGPRRAPAAAQENGSTEVTVGPFVFGSVLAGSHRATPAQIVHTLLETVYLDVEHGPVVAIEPKAEFAPLFGMVAAGEDQDGDPARAIVILPPGAELPR